MEGGGGREGGREGGGEGWRGGRREGWREGGGKDGEEGGGKDGEEGGGENGGNEEGKMEGRIFVHCVGDNMGLECLDFGGNVAKGGMREDIVRKSSHCLEQSLTPSHVLSRFRRPRPKSANGEEDDVGGLGYVCVSTAMQ